jgi:hypothetical protein
MQSRQPALIGRAALPTPGLKASRLRPAQWSATMIAPAVATRRGTRRTQVEVAVRRILWPPAAPACSTALPLIETARNFRFRLKSIRMVLDYDSELAARAALRPSSIAVPPVLECASLLAPCFGAACCHVLGKCTNCRPVASQVIRRTHPYRVHLCHWLAGRA